MADCIFCKIANGEIPSQKVYEDDFALVFKDLDPQAPAHVLVVPKKHFDNVVDENAREPEIMQRLINAACEAAKKLGVTENGFRLVINTGKDGGQSVEHLHIHLLGMRELGWPPG